MYKCNEMKQYNNVYKKLVRKINEITKNMVIIFDEIEYKTNIKISKDAKIEINNAYFIKNNNGEIK
jgi:esterase/lipase